MFALRLPLALLSELDQASAANGVMTLKHGRVYIVTGAGAVSEVELGPGKGDLTISGLEAAAYGKTRQSEAVVVEDRGDFLELVEGKQTYPQVSLNIIHRGALTSTTDRTVLDTLLNTGKVLTAADATVDPGGIVWTGNWYWVASRAGVSARIDMSNVRAGLDYSEAAEGNAMPVKGSVYGGVTFS